MRKYGWVAKSECLGLTHTQRRHFISLVGEKVCGLVRQEGTHQPAWTRDPGASPTTFIGKTKGALLSS